MGKLIQNHVIKNNNMKNIMYLLSVIFCISFINCAAQNNYHRTDPHADKIVKDIKVFR